MNTRRIAGVVLFIVGIGVLLYGLNASNSMVDQVSETLRGRYTERTTWYIIGGSVSSLFGFLILVFGRKA